MARSSSAKPLWGRLIALILGGLMLLLTQPAASAPAARFGLPFADPPGPDTWLLGQPYGNTVGAFALAGAIGTAPARAFTSGWISRPPAGRPSSPSAMGSCLKWTPASTVQARTTC